MSKSLVLGFLLFLQMVESQTIKQPSSMSLSEDRLTISKHGNETTLQFACTSRVGTCSFAYQILPKDWRADGNSLIFPTFYLDSIRSFLVRANISEPTGESMVRDIVIDFTDGPSLYSTLLDSRVGADLVTNLSLSESISSKDIEKVPVVNEFGETFLQAQGITPYLPSIAKIDTVIVSSDSFKISSMIQNIVSYKQPCSQKSKYLDSVVFRIQEHIDFNKKLLAAEQANLRMEENGLKSLEQQRKNINDQLNLLKDKDKIKKELSRLEGEKQTSFNKYYSYEIVAIRYQDRMKELAIEGVVNPQQLETLKVQVAKDRTELQSIDAEIKKLEKRKADLEKKLRENQRKINDTMNSAEGTTDKNKVSQLQNTYNQYMTMSNQYKTQYENTEKQLAALNLKLSTLESSVNRLTARLKEIQGQIDQIKQQNSSTQMQSIQKRLDVLQRNLPKLQAQVEQCKKQLGSTTVGKQSKSEGVSEEIKAEKQKPTYDIADLRIKNRNSNAVNIFSSKWIKSYGVPRTYSFTCSIGSGLITRYGKIIKIQSAAIAVEGQSGEVYVVHIGSCTRITGPASSFSPKIGDIIDWSGYLESNGIYNGSRINFYAIN